jgi:NADPH:quinone reductase-like Zn-dependent oxidoreductase
MRIIGCAVFGGPEVLTAQEVPRPEPLKGEVRIRVHGAAVNPTDLAFREGFYRAALTGNGSPFVPGMDVAGTIDALGAEVDGWSHGDAVMAVVNAPHVPGAYADFVVVPVTSIASIPSTLSLHEAAALPMNALTARIALDSLPQRSFGTIAVTGAAGAVGGFAIQLAKHRGYTVIADAAEVDVELVRSLGADYVVPRGNGFADAVRGLQPQGVDAIIDAAVQTLDILPAIRDGGHFVPLRGWSGTLPRGIVAHPVMVSDHVHASATLSEIAQLVDDGSLTVRVADVLPPESATEAHARVAQGGVRGRIVLDFSERASDDAAD